ncbi:unnamed protein product, partial [marine sediment metagenome]
QLEIADLFNCRFPSDEEFVSMLPMVQEVIKLDAQIEVLTDLLATIVSNKRCI